MAFELSVPGTTRALPTRSWGWCTPGSGYEWRLQAPVDALHMRTQYGGASKGWKRSSGARATRKIDVVCCANEGVRPPPLLVPSLLLRIQCPNMTQAHHSPVAHLSTHCLSYTHATRSFPPRVNGCLPGARPHMLREHHSSQRLRSFGQGLCSRTRHRSLFPRPHELENPHWLLVCR